MKIGIIFLLAVITHAVFSVKRPAKAKPIYPKTKLVNIKRPNFYSPITELLNDMAEDNGYKAFDKCHVLSWKFMQEVVAKHWSKKVDKKYMQQFILQLATKHTDAAFYKALSPTTKKDLLTLTKDFKERALDALDAEDSKQLQKYLFNMPSNLYPGDSTRNRMIQENLDPPKKASPTGARTNEASLRAKLLYKKYRGRGLTVKPDPTNVAMVLSSDKPPKDKSKDYIKITV